MSSPLVMGAVAYDAKVVTIWEGFRRWFADQGLAFDWVLYSNYERQVDDLLGGRIDVAWNSPTDSTGRVALWAFDGLVRRGWVAARLVDISYARQSGREGCPDAEDVPSGVQA